MRPLEGITVLDFSRLLAGPFCTMLLGDAGARVIKVEAPGRGDDTRAFGPPFTEGESAYFMSVNRSKESVTLDLKHPRGRALAQALAARADLLVENFRPGTAERLGIGFEEVRALNERIIYVTISGYGRSGLPEYSRRPGYDLVVQGLGGIPSLTGPVDGGPSKVGTSIADLISGLYGLIGALMALHVRERTGKGQLVDVSMLDGQISLLSFQAGICFAEGRPPRRSGNAHPTICPYETFSAADGHVNIAVGNDRLWLAFCDVIGLPGLAREPRFATNALRVQNRAALLEVLVPLIGARPVEAWLETLDAAGIPAGPILDVQQALNHPQVLARGMVTELEHPRAGRVRVTGFPIGLSETPGEVRTPPPGLGEHTEAVLREVLGLDEAELAELGAAGVW